MIPKKLPKLEQNKKDKRHEPKPKEINNNEELQKQLSTKLPKSEYDNNGRPILNIDGLDDTDLSNQIGQFLK